MAQVVLKQYSLKMVMVLEKQDSSKNEMIHDCCYGCPCSKLVKNNSMVLEKISFEKSTVKLL